MFLRLQFVTGLRALTELTSQYRDAATRSLDLYVSRACNRNTWFRLARDPPLKPGQIRVSPLLGDLHSPTFPSAEPVELIWSAPYTGIEAEYPRGKLLKARRPRRTRPPLGGTSAPELVCRMARIASEVAIRALSGPATATRSSLLRVSGLLSVRKVAGRER